MIGVSVKWYKEVVSSSRSVIRVSACDESTETLSLEVLGLEISNVSGLDPNVQIICGYVFVSQHIS